MIILCNGCWDGLHYGHLLHLKEASTFGECLYVSVTRDEFVNKGPGRPFFPQEERLEMVKALSIVHGAILCDSSIDAIKQIEPDIFVKGPDYIGKIREEDMIYCKENDIQIVFTSSKKYSSTALHDRLRQG